MGSGVGGRGVESVTLSACASAPKHVHTNARVKQMKNVRRNTSAAHTWLFLLFSVDQKTAQ